MQTELQLVFGPVVSHLSHSTELYFEVLLEGIAYSRIGTVPVEDLYRPTVTDIPLSIDEEFIV